MVVNLYPFAATVAAGASELDAVEQIDIGGPAMVRAAAKNHANVAIVVSPDRYDEVIAAIAAGGTTLAQRKALAREAFRHTASYDVAVASWLGSVVAQDQPVEESPFPAWVGGTWTKDADLRYGENSHQRAALYASHGWSSRHRAGGAAARQGDVVQQLRRRGCRGAGRLRLRRAGRRDHQARQPVRHRDRVARGIRPHRRRAPARARVRPGVGVRRRHRGEPPP